LTHFIVSRVAGPATPSATGIVQTGSYLGSGAGPLLFGVGFAAVAEGASEAGTVWIPVAAAQLVAMLVVLRLARAVPPAPAHDVASRSR
jgi:hypothetical protein